MKYRLTNLISAGLVASALVITPVALAETNTGTSTVSNNSTTTTTTTTSSDDTSNIETENHDMSSRIAKFKTKFKVDLTVAEQAKLKLHCVAAQNIIGKLNDKFGNSVTTRTKAYTELQNRLTKLIANLKTKSVDTTTLEQEQTVLNTKIATYTTDLAAYKQSLADLKAVDCKTDPTGFKAALEAARSAHDTIVADVLAVRTYLVGTIKPTLQGILKTLDTTSSTN